MVSAPKTKLQIKMDNSGTCQWVDDVRMKMRKTLKDRKTELNLVLRHLERSSVWNPESHWHTLRFFLDDDEGFNNFLDDLIKQFQKIEELLESGSKKVANEPVGVNVHKICGTLIGTGIAFGCRAYQGDVTGMASFAKAIAPAAGTLAGAGIQHFLRDYVEPDKADMFAAMGTTVITEFGNYLEGKNRQSEFSHFLKKEEEKYRICGQCKDQKKMELEIRPSQNLPVPPILDSFWPKRCNDKISDDFKSLMGQPFGPLWLEDIGTGRHLRCLQKPSSNLDHTGHP